MNITRYINRINNNDLSLTEIQLINKNLRDADLKPLMAALAKNPNSAKRIVKLDLSDNQLTSFDARGLTGLKRLYLKKNILTYINVQGLTLLSQLDIEDNLLTNINLQGLDRLEWLFLENNPLTTAYVIALTHLANTFNFAIISGAPPLDNNSLLTRDILDSHFKPILTIKHKSMQTYVDKAVILLSASPESSSSAKILSNFPIDIINNILKYEVAEIALARDSMNNFKNIFSNLPLEDTTKNQQLSFLIDYEAVRLKELIQNAENSYCLTLVKLEQSVESVKAERLLQADKPKSKHKFIKALKNFNLFKGYSKIG